MYYCINSSDRQWLICGIGGLVCVHVEEVVTSIQLCMLLLLFLKFNCSPLTDNKNIIIYLVPHINVILWTAITENGV